MKKITKILIFLLSLPFFFVIIFFLGMILTTHANWRGIEEGARNGNRANQFLIASGYENGYNQSHSLGYFQKDLVKAAFWYKKACDNGHSEACIKLKRIEKVAQ
jgi:TPR repeat protein